MATAVDDASKHRTYEAVQYVEAHPEVYSSSHLLGGILIVDPPEGHAAHGDRRY